VAVDIENSGCIFKASGQVVKFIGYMALYDHGDDEENQEEGVSMSTLPAVKKNAVLEVEQFEAKQHYTEPPARYTEASLIKFLEENGIGRPSTYAPIISIIIARDYVRREGRVLTGTKLGEITTDFMKKYFPEIVDYEFTAEMESGLDAIENSENTIVGLIGEFYKTFTEELERANGETKEKLTSAMTFTESEYDCPICGKKMIYKTGRYGRFLACPDYPSCKSTVAVDKDGAPVKQKEKATEIADFKCELCGGDMILRSGRYGNFYACVNYPTCKFTKQKITETGIKCPLCDGRILARHSKENSKFYSCSNYPECDFSSWDRPLEDKCPDCGSMLYYRRTRKAVICKNRDCEYRRDEEMTED
jgi:DNA topoisomerase-1